MLKSEDTSETDNILAQKNIFVNSGHNQRLLQNIRKVIIQPRSPHLSNLSDNKTRQLVD